MQRVKRSSAVVSLPAAPGGGTPGFFALPNPGGGVPATVPGYEWFNSVQEEICAVIAAAGISLDIANTGQMLAALPGALAASSAMARSLASRGYQKLPGGLILQWGYDAASTGGTAVSYPIAFPNACLQVLIGQAGANGVTYQLGALTPSAFTFFNTTTNGSHRWLAIGY